MRRVLLRFSNPIISMQVGSKELRMPLSHSLPLLRCNNSNYDTALSRLTPHILKAHGSLITIDVGANIGDTVALVSEGLAGRFLCIEPEAKYFALLKENTKSMNGVTCMREILSDEAGRPCSLQVLQGTASSFQDENSEQKTETLDRLLTREPEFQKANLLKIDTDGFDFRVLRGARHLLSEAKPVIFFELSPRHYVKAGQDDPQGVLPFLITMKYKFIIFYDWTGHLIAGLDASKPEAASCLSQLVSYAHVLGRYYDVLAFHEEQEESYKIFLRNETDRFAPPLPNEYNLS